MAHLTPLRVGAADPPLVVPTPGFRWIMAAVLGICVALVLVTAYSYFYFDHLIDDTVVRVEQVAAVLLETTEGHLWFEEVISGDQNEEISTVWAHFDAADENARALLEGTGTEEGGDEYLADASFRYQTLQIISLLEEFRSVAEERYDHAQSSQTGTRIDQSFDGVFDELITNAKALDRSLRQESDRKLRFTKLIYSGLILVYLLLTVVLLSVLRRYESNQVTTAALLITREGQLRQAQKMEAVGNLAGGIAHDFNNLLQAIIGYGEVLADDLAEERRSTVEIDMILKAGRRAADLTRQLLVYSRRQVISPVDLDLNDLINNHLNMLQRLIGENITMETVQAKGPVIVHADRAQMEQILTNLCINARDAIAGAGTVTIETTTVEVDEAYCVDHPWAQIGQYVLLNVTDDGCGMDQTTMAQVFEPFFTTKVVGKGTGLGLSTVYGIVKQNDGMINVYSEIDQGTSFKTYWPLVDGLPEAEATTLSYSDVGGNETILVAEDDATVRGFVTHLLAANGYRVIAAVDGQSAIDIFNTEVEAIDLALLDVVMPHKSGREVLEHIRRSGSEIPVIFASGYSLNAIHTDFVLDKGIVLLEKPYRRHELLSRLREALQVDG